MVEYFCKYLSIIFSKIPGCARMDLREHDPCFLFDSPARLVEASG